MADQSALLSVWQLPAGAGSFADQIPFELSDTGEDRHNHLPGMGKVGSKPVGTDVVQTVLAPDLDDLEPRLTQRGYNAKVLAELLNAKPREIKALLHGQLESCRIQELRREMQRIGIPV